MDKKQKLRYSRQIKTYGRDMQQRLMQMKYFIYGMRGLGAEVAKHLILNGVRQVDICDPTIAEIRDLGANYFISQETIDGKKTRAEASVDALRRLNNHVIINVIPELTLESLKSKENDKYDGVIITEAYGIDWSSQSPSSSLNIYDLNFMLRHQGTCLLLTETGGLFGYCFNDFGEEYRVLSTGIEEEQLLIKQITFEPECVVTTFADSSECFEKDDIVEFLNIEGAMGIHVLNEKEYQILELIGDHKIRINWDTSMYVDMRPGAKLSLKKRGETINFFSLQEALDTIKMSMLWGQKKHMFLPKLLLTYRKQQSKIEILMDDVGALTELATSTAFREEFESEFGTEFDKEINSTTISKFVRTLSSELISMTSVLGGIVAAEALKITGKYTPIVQWYAFDQTKYLPEEVKSPEDQNRYSDNITSFGLDTQNDLSKMNVFLPGVGAIGCEVLKWLACYGVGLTDSNGKVTIVDFDTLEISNLNRQFLFSDKDRRKPKATIAKKRIALINPEMNVEAHKKKLDIDSYNSKFGFSFWNGLDLVINGLDNIPGRVFLDIKWIEHEKVFLETGTEGQMGHTSVIIPFKTSTYTDYRILPPKERAKEKIPFCTLRNEPHTIHHCTEWAISKFDDHFTSGFRDLRIFLDTTLPQHDLTFGQIVSLIKMLEWLSKIDMNITLEACLE